MSSGNEGNTINHIELIRLERRNFIFVSCILLFLKLTGALIIASSSVSGIGIKIPDSCILTASGKVLITLWTLWLYFLWRYYQFFRRIKLSKNFQQDFYFISKDNKKFSLSGDTHQSLIELINKTAARPNICFFNIPKENKIIMFNPFSHNDKKLPDANNTHYYTTKSTFDYYWMRIQLWIKAIFLGTYISEYYIPLIFALITPILYLI